MKKNNLIATTFALAALGTSFVSNNVFAEEDYYGMNYDNEYRGGLVLGVDNGVNNVIEKPDLETLLPIIRNDGETKTTFSDGWTKGWVKGSSGECQEVRYAKVKDGTQITEANGLNFTVSWRDYSLKAKVKSIKTKNQADFTSVGITSGTSSISASFDIYDEGCAGDPHTYDTVSMEDSSQVFVNLETRLYKNNVPFNHEGVYFGFTDIDASQSFKILNDGNKMTASNMYSPSIELLQTFSSNLSPEDGGPLHNMFVPDSNFIYSQYTGTFKLHAPNTEVENGIFVPLSMSTQTDGLDVVFGYGSRAYSSVLYYAQQYTVVYESDDNGKIDGITNEVVFPAENPSSSTTKPNKGYELSYWVADKDVTLEDGTEIAAGEPITEEEIKKVVVEEDITFTAIHEKTPVVVPDTGSIADKELNGAVVPASIAGIIALATVLFYLPRVNHKKVSFRKK